MILVLMDFDGTITKKDTFIEFIRFNKSLLSFYLGFFILSPIILAYKLKIVPNWKAKEIVFSYFFKGLKEEIIVESGNMFTEEHLPKLLRQEAVDEITKHKKNGIKIAVVTASFPIWIRPWCHKHNLGLIATQHETKNGKITGKIKGKNCFGIEKVNRIKEDYDLSKFAQIYAYGDSKGDMEMLNIADIKFMKWKKVD